MRAYRFLLTAAILGAISPPAFAWRPGGVELLGMDAEPRPVSDLLCRARSDGGLLAYLLDQRDGTSSVYVQAVTPDGFREWTPGGVLGTPGRANELAELLSGDGVVMLARRASDGVFGPWRVAALDDRGAVSTGWPADGHVVSPVGRDGMLAAAGRYLPCPLGLGVPCPGGAYVAWISDPDANGPGELRLHALDGGAPSLGWPAEGVHVADVPGAFEAVWLVPSVDGGVHVVWACKPNRGHPPGLFVARVTADGAFAPGWSFGGLAVFGDVPNGLRALPDGAGGLYLVWSASGEPGQLPWRTLAQRITANGQIADGWPANGVLVARATMVNQMDAAGDGLGGLYVAWTAPPTTGRDNHQLTVRRLDGTGARHADWPADDLLLATSPGLMELRLLQAGNDGFHVAVTARDGFATSGTLRLHRRTANSGVPPGAPASGQLLASVQNVYFVALLDDHQGGSLAVWSYWDDSAQSGGTVAQRFGPTTWPTPSGQRPAFQLGNVRPQPATGVARFTLSVGQRTTVQVAILDVQGRVVRTLPRATMDPGPREFVWDGRDDGGDPVRSGVYFATVRTQERSARARIVITR